MCILRIKSVGDNVHRLMGVQAAQVACQRLGYRHQCTRFAKCPEFQIPFSKPPGSTVVGVRILCPEIAEIRNPGNLVLLRESLSNKVARYGI